MESINVIKAIKSLSQCVINSTMLAENEKNILLQLLDRLSTYYSTQYEDIINHEVNIDCSYRMNKLTSEITNCIVLINETINGKYDIMTIVNEIYKEINYDNKKGFFKRKRLLK